MAVKFKVTQLLASQWMAVVRNQNISLPGTEASVKQIKQTKIWRCSLDHRAGKFSGTELENGRRKVQPLLSGICLFSPSLSLAPGWQAGYAHKTENVTTRSCIFTHPKSPNKVPEASIVKLALLTSPPWTNQVNPECSDQDSGPSLEWGNRISPTLKA